MKLRNTVRKPRLSKRRRAVELGKDVLILLLICSAVSLVGRSQIYTVAGDKVWFSSLSSFFAGQESEVSPSLDPGRPASLPHPVRIAVCGQGGESVSRYGIQYDTVQVEQVFGALSGFLSEGLASARDAHTVSALDWQQALKTPGLYFDFLGSVPMELMVRWASEGGDVEILPGSARRLVLTAEEGAETATLYYMDDQQGLYYACNTSVVCEGYLNNTLLEYGDNGARFAFEREEESYRTLAPEVLLLPDAPAAQRYQVTQTLELSDETVRAELERTLGFRGSDYSIGDAWVLRDGDGLRLSENGDVFYEDGEALSTARYPVGQGSVSLSEAVEAGRNLFYKALEAWCGTTANEAQIYLKETLEQPEGGWEIRFGYTLGGADVSLEDGEAASFTVREDRITSYEMHLRCYTATGEETLVLPETQAIAALSALDLEAGADLSLCYLDDGNSAQASWMAG